LQENVGVFYSPYPLAPLTQSDVRFETKNNYVPIIFIPLTYPLGNELNYIYNLTAVAALLFLSKKFIKQLANPSLVLSLLTYLCIALTNQKIEHLVEIWDKHYPNFLLLCLFSWYGKVEAGIYR